MTATDDMSDPAVPTFLNADSAVAVNLPMRRYCIPIQAPDADRAGYSCSVCGAKGWVGTVAYGRLTACEDCAR
jgi:hypothetical protein